jgi:TIR protein
MARCVTNRRPNAVNPGFNTVVDDICRGHYVLVLGSDVILDTELNPEAHGDSARFFISKVLATKNEQGRNYSDAETFPRLIIDNSLNSNEVRKWLLDEIATNLFDPWDLNPDLVRLLKSKCFRIVLSTTFDPAVELLMNLVWGEGKYRIMNISNARANNFDFKQNEALGDEYFDIEPTLYYVFGKADPMIPDAKFVLEDNDTLEFISKWLSNEGPTRLISYIDTKKLLVLGCNLKDWCFRFFWYAMRHKEAANLKLGDIAVLLHPEQSEQDRNLYDYLTKTANVRIQTESRTYIRRLADALDEKMSVNSAELLSNLGGIFISYASEDFAIAWNVFTRLREAGFNVWLDNKKLSVGNNYDPRIENAINQCRVFMPILTGNVAHVLKNDIQRYFPTEWELATGENSDATYFQIVTPGYDISQPYHLKVPEKIRKATIFDWQREPFSKLIEEIKSVLKA